MLTIKKCILPGLGRGDFKAAVRVGLGRRQGMRLTFEDLSEGAATKFFHDFEATLQDLLTFLQHIVLH